MFSKLAAVTAVSLSVLAAATPTSFVTRQSCSTGSVQCCNTVEKASSPSAATILGGLDVVLQDLNVLVGLTCSPISIVGVGSGSACSAQTVCCEDNSHGSLISIGCVPVTA
ncbi:hydrophobin [Phlebiopsis gigantea 11061_1 CR5-6]|uniref:Hydrophobin n=1 Tax=Phlebiopsis gigantea (strain 11061_1 CR5-6) TaxID=745531 RepID=A0A0C3NSK6_PHLG1|nr:hydrophobin [Phlebiopsis gigantea 11061_1 CR5-6]